MKQHFNSFIALVVVIGANLFAWSWLNRPVDMPAWHGKITGFSFSPMRRDENPLTGKNPTPEEIDSDLQLLSDKVTAVRTYGMDGGLELVPELAAKHGLYVTAGAWISSDLKRNDQQVDELIKAGQTYRNVVRLMVGNESILRGDVSVGQLITYIRKVRNRVGHRVSTAEPWRVWLDHPELAREVDFISIHALPYWEGTSIDNAVDQVFEMYDTLQKAYPDKPIIFSEVGWPSSGPVLGSAVPSLLNQARFLREFLNRVQSRDIVYYIVEAFDQPWKKNLEGPVGEYWGVYNVDRRPKFPMTGAIEPDPDWKQWAGMALLLGIIPVLYFILTRQRVSTRGKLLFAIVINFAASAIAWTASIGANQYLTPLSATYWVVLIVLQVFALLVLLVETVEVSELLWRKGSHRDFQPLAPSPEYSHRKVSIHLPIHNEPPEMVRLTLQALAQLDYPDYEVLVIDNNTRDEYVWRPVEELCYYLGPRFRFFHLENWPGYKAGALNFALRNTSIDSEFIAVIDSDYIVRPDWLKSMAPYFEDYRVGFVQAPQDYRDEKENLFKRMCYWEYAGFFHIGMVQRNDFNAIIQHGTMTLMRKTALMNADGWAEWCITEDAELGLRLLRKGYDSVYVNQSFGRGLMPDTLSAYKTQRFRWAYGAMQIMKHHLSALLPFSKRGLNAAQKYYFVAGWLPWLSDGLALLFVFASLWLSVDLITVFPPTNLPLEAFVFPTIGIFSFKVLRSFWLYTVRVRSSFKDTLLALIAGLALTHCVGKAVLSGLLTKGRPFVRTPKLEQGRPIFSAWLMVWEELLLFIMLTGAAYWIWSIHYFHTTQGKLWVGVLLVQSIPYLAAVIMVIINVFSSVSRQRTKPVSSRPVAALDVLNQKVSAD